ncbi:MAG: substrate-binding domain-containing protein [Lachnospiraceae bacterium]|nr:substrate-binding domain-containing protein [Lachnospiraceae bacterium]
MKRRMLTRRDFLRTAAVGGTGLAAMGLVGCSSSDSSTSTTDSSSETETSSSDSSEETAENSNFNETGYPIVNEPITLNVMMAIRDQDSLTNTDEMPALQRLEEQTNIHVEWEIIKDSDWDTKLNLAFASGEYPDIIICCSSSVDDEEYGVTQGIVIPLDDLINQHMPNYTSRRDAEEDDPTVSLIASDGQVYSVGYLVGQNINTQQHFFINQDWLDALDLDTPDNVDDMTDVLRAFANNDPNGNGDTDEVALEMDMDIGFYGIRYMLPLFGLPVDPDKWIYIDDEKQVQFAPVQDKFREGMEWFHTLYEEGLLDPEVFSQDGTTIGTKLAEGNVGFFAAWRLLAMGFDDGVAANSVLWTPDSASLYRYLEIATDGAYITCTNQYVAESMRWLDAMLETEMMFSLHYGEEGTADQGSGWEYDENGKINSTVDGTTETESWFGSNALFFAPGIYISETFNMPEQRIEKTEYCDLYDEAGLIQKYSNDYLDMAPLTSDQLASCTLVETDIKNAVAENMTAFIKDGVTDDSWNTFVTMFDNMGVADYVQMYQDAIDTMDLG